ncbi:TadE/TadG family type IV pilus assembly protein [Leptospira interrogans]
MTFDFKGFSSRLGWRTPAPIRRFLRDEHGGYIIFMALALPFMAGMAGLGSEGAIWLFKKRALQGAADNASYSAANAYAVSTTSDLLLQAKAIAANSGLVHGTDGVTVALNHPPASGCGTASTYNGNNRAIEVTVTQTVTRYFSSFYSGAGSATICSRSISLVSGGGDCVLALGTTGTGIKSSGNGLNLTLTGCSLFSNSKDAAAAISLSGNGSPTIDVDTIGAVGGTNLGGQISNCCDIAPTSGNPPIPDPYATLASTTWPQSPSGTAQLGNPGTNGKFNCCNLSPGNYSKGLELSQNGSYVMAPGIYYVTGSLKFTATNTQLTGNGVTIIVTGDFDAKTNNSTLTITAPTTGSTAGLAIWKKGAGSFDMGRNNFTAQITGLVYAPSSTIAYAGNSGTAASPLCLQLVAGAVEFTGNKMFLKGDCSGVPGIKTFGQTTALVQ